MSGQVVHEGPAKTDPGRQLHCPWPLTPASSPCPRCKLAPKLFPDWRTQARSLVSLRSWDVRSGGLEAGAEIKAQVFRGGQ